MIEAGSRRRGQPAPPHVVYEALTQPNRDAARPWLLLLDYEQPPKIVEANNLDLVVGSSLWERRPDARIRFELPRVDSRYGTDLRWVLLVDEPAPDSSLPGHMRRQINGLINANLRYLRSVGHAGVAFRIPADGQWNWR